MNNLVTQEQIDVVKKLAKATRHTGMVGLLVAAPNMIKEADALVVCANIAELVLKKGIILEDM